jgi:hypothetical protein
LQERVAVLNTRNVASQQASAFFDVPLREVFFLTQFAEPFADNHAGIMPDTLIGANHYQAAQQ